MAEDVPTLGELSRTIDRMDARINAQFEAVNRRLDGLQFVSQDVYRSEMAAVVRRLDEKDEEDRWKARAILGAFVFTPVAVAIGAVLSAAVR